MSYAGLEDEYVDPAAIYQGPLHSFQRHINARAQVEEELGRAYHDLMVRYREKCKECDHQRRNAQIWERHQLMTEKELNHLKSFADSSIFAYVVIDGDGAVFHEDFISSGEEGGRAAAHELHKELKVHFQDQHGISSIDIFVQVVLSIEGLSNALRNTGTVKVPDPAILAKFARGFCRAQPLFSVVDVGFGKEQADHKVRKVFEIMEKNIHCRALVLGGCHDNGYATFLESYRNNSKITLLETTPAAADFRRLRFHRVQFPNVFRSEPLPPRLQAPPGFSSPQSVPPPTVQVQPSTQGIPIHLKSPTTTLPPKSATPVLAEIKKNAENRPPSSWAAVGRTGGTVQTIDISSKKTTSTRPFYLLNGDDERLDVPLPKFDQSTKDSFEAKMARNDANFCNKYHLLGSCRQGDMCPYIHGERLSPAEQNVLKLRARGLPCTAGSKCWDANCTSGHHCPNPNSCYYRDGCRFADMHGMDTTPTVKIYEDGSREIITK